MKKLFILILLSGLACTNMNKPLSDAEKAGIISEAKGCVSTIIQVCEKAQPDTLKAIYLESPDFVSLVGGVYSDYEQSLKGMYAYFENVKAQKATITSEKYSVLDANTVLYSGNSKWEVTMKNDSMVIMNPVGMQFLLKKVDGKWRVLSWTEEM